ncbi:four-carbon acid sugar kinase family protein [Neobacillus drentensis]|uniref:four-carbon acid sugar kinase family protein n=1 Tax=Neobacillus drentensis TaxID=220684 RepID=UPI001F294692|nr:four-carbon acid sugar kinase family protein [Neobacillus drentensis]ULT57644.1 four-carbon acid sugar kinase family protein [Neobacillus drentensis]
MMQRFYIIADDLTGANDAGVQLSKIGISSTVFFDYKDSSLQSIEDVAIIDTDSRALSEEAAYETIQNASSIFRKQGYEQVYKKMDSTLRGNVAAELAALVSVYQPEIIVVAPAFPKMNRQTINGYQYVNGERVSETEFGRDPKTPVKESFIPDLLKKYVDDRICLIDQSLLNSSNENLTNKIVENTGHGTTWFICDAATDDDLKMIAETFGQFNKKTVWAGSAGLIEYLPNALQLKKAEINQQEALGIEQTLTVSASLSLVTKQQLEMVKMMPDTHFVEIDPVNLIKKTYRLSEIIDEFTKESYKKHFVLFVDSSVENREATKQLGTELSLGNTQISEAISMELGVIAKAIVHSMPTINGLILTGGDTAKAVCNQLNMNQMQLYTEIEAGLPLGKLGNATNAQRYWTVTKAGGFGNEHSLLNALKFMTREDV